jgi:hypothetical protein
LSGRDASVAHVTLFGRPVTLLADRVTLHEDFVTLR